MVGKTMYPKLNPDPIYLQFNGRELTIPREKIMASFAGAWAAKECVLDQLFEALVPPRSFKEHYQEVIPACITAANQVGVSATVDTLEYWNPGKHINERIKDRLQHQDNPFYPFFEED